MRILLASLITFAVSASAVWGHETVPDPGLEITSDFGPRFVPGPDFHKGADYRRAFGAAVPLLEDGTIIQMRRSAVGNPFVAAVTGGANGHQFRYLHMFNDNPAPITSGDFTLTTTESGTPVVIRWTAGHFGARADYMLAEFAGEFVTFNGARVLTPDGALEQETIVQVTRAQHPALGPAGTSGGVDVHLHVDMGFGISENPFAHIGHPASNFVVQLLDGAGNPRPNGFIPNPQDPASSFIKVRINSAVGMDLESVEVFVDQTNFGGLVRTWSYGGFTPAHDTLQTDIETANCPAATPGCRDLDPPVFSDGARNGVRPGGAGLEDFVFTDWQAANTAVSPSNLSEGEHNLIVCWTNIRNVTNCDTRVTFIVRRTGPAINVGAIRGLYKSFSGISPLAPMPFT